MIEDFDFDIDIDGEDDILIDFKCKTCGFIEGVPSWIVAEVDEMNSYAERFKRKKSIPEFQCPKCDKIMIPLSEFKD